MACLDRHKTHSRLVSQQGSRHAFNAHTMRTRSLMAGQVGQVHGMLARIRDIMVMGRDRSLTPDVMAAYRSAKTRGRAAEL